MRGRLTALEEAYVLLHSWCPAVAWDTCIPKLIYWPALDKADYHSSNIDHKLNPY